MHDSMIQLDDIRSVEVFLRDTPYLHVVYAE